MPKLQLADIELYYEIHGSGEPLLLIAGLASDSQSWLPVLEPLRERYQLILPDNRGCGRTTPLQAPLSVAQLSRDCEALLDHLALPCVNVLGHSMGGLVALELAARCPDRVSRLLLAATAACNTGENNTRFRQWADTLADCTDPETWLRELFAWLFTDDFLQNPQAVATALDYALNYPYPQPPAAFANQVEAIAAFDGRPLCASVTAKTCILCGEHDRLFPPQVSRESLGAIPRHTCHTVPRAAHSIHPEQPAAFAEQVCAFLG